MTTVLLAAAISGVTAPPSPQLYRSPWALADAPELYRHASPTTCTHETTHGVNSMLRQRYGGACFYIGQRRFFHVAKLEQPTLERIALAVRYRGRTATLYLDRARYPLTPQRMANGVYLEGHEHDPLHLFNELCAYTNASRIPGSNRSSLSNALELAHYAATVVEQSPAGYRDRPELARIWCWFARQLEPLVQRAERTGQCFEPRQRGWLSQLRRDYLRVRVIAEQVQQRTAQRPPPNPARRAAPPPQRYRATVPARRPGST